MRPTLRPGLTILRRDANTVQLGLDWPGVGALPETPALRQVLAAVDGFRDAQGVVLAAAATGLPLSDCHQALDALIDCGVVVDQARTLRPECSESSWASMWLLAGPGRDGLDVFAQRRACRAHVDGAGRVADLIRGLLAEAHVATTLDPATADVVVLADDSEPHREAADAIMHSGLPHLWAYVRELVGVVGPFVVPGRSTCLRCVDTARAELDPAWPTLLESLAVSRNQPSACDHALAALVAAWAAQEVAVWASGLRPQTWDRVIEVPHGFGVVDAETFVPHPKCGCGWPVWQDTMGA